MIFVGCTLVLDEGGRVGRCRVCEKGRVKPEGYRGSMQEIVAICRTNTTVKPPYILVYKTFLPKMSINSNFKFRVCLVHRSKVELRSLDTAMVHGG